MVDVFVSHSSADMALARRVEGALERDGLRVWLDESEIRPGRLLRNELTSAIEGSRVVALIWSKAAAKSRWVGAEILTAFHLGRFIIACARDETPLPYFLQNTLYLNARPRKTGWLRLLRRGVREAPGGANAIPPNMAGSTVRLDEAMRALAEAQSGISGLIRSNDLAGAREYQRALDPGMKGAEKKWPLHAMILNLAGYHRKNAYILKHWDAIVAGRPPKSPLLGRAERFFFESLFVDPLDVSALNGLGSILIYEREFDAAEFFIRRAIHLADDAGLDYPEAKHDLDMVLRLKDSRPATPGPRRGPVKSTDSAGRGRAGRRPARRSPAR